MREELVRMGVQELRTSDEVDGLLKGTKGTALVFVNSVCGCAAGMARPGLALAMRNGTLPDKIATVFAGVDTDATNQIRSYFPEYPPSSPQVALFKDGSLLDLVQRHQIEGTSPEAVAERLAKIFDQHCAPASTG
jgi:putative YphP/YqiW family bacilliredoxin